MASQAFLDAFAPFIGQDGPSLAGGLAQLAPDAFGSGVPGGGYGANPGVPGPSPAANPATFAAPPQQAQSSSPYHGVGGFLGKLGDTLLSITGNAPIYGPRQQQKQLASALQNFVGPNSPYAPIIAADPGTGMQMWSAAQPKPEAPAQPYTLGPGQVRFGPNGEVLARGPDQQQSNQDPTFIRELQDLGIDPHSPQALELYYGRNSPAGYLLKPPAQGGGSENLPRVTSEADIAKLPPGARFILPDGSIGRAPGGAGGNAGGVFH